MAIQQYDYTACCTGFLQQLPSFWGIRQNRRGRAVLAKWCTVTNGAGSSKAGGVGGCRDRGGSRRERRAHFAGPVPGVHNMSVRKK